MAQKLKKIIVQSDLIERHPWLEVLAKKLRLEIFRVEDGEETLERTKVELPDIIFLDVSIPKVNGIECSHVIKKLSASIKVILFSEVNSLSLQDSAKRALADLFVVDSVASVKVPEFVGAIFSRKELPPDVSEDVEREILSRRGSPRFPIEGEVQYPFRGEWRSGIFVNVSLDGLSFRANQPLSEGEKLRISWMDRGEQHMEVSALVVRQIPSDDSENPYLVGVQFLEAYPQIDRRVSELSESLESQDHSEIDLDLDLIREVLDKGLSYFQEMFAGGKPPFFLESSISDVVEHERNSFQNSDDFSICIQELVSCKILCQLITSGIDSVSSGRPSFQPQVKRILAMTTELLKNIHHAEQNSDHLVKRAIQTKSANRNQINESNNRLYRAKTDMLEAVAQKIKLSSVHPADRKTLDAIVEQHKQVTSFQQHLDEIAKEEITQIKTSGRMVAPHEKTPTKTTSNAPRPAKRTRQFLEVEEEKTNYIWPGFAFLIVLAVSLPLIQDIFHSFGSHHINLIVPIRGITQDSASSLRVDMQKESWSHAGSKGQNLIMDQIEVYLTRKNSHQAKITDGDVLIAAVYGTVFDSPKAFLHTEFGEKPTPADQASK